MKISNDDISQIVVNYAVDRPEIIEEAHNNGITIDFLANYIEANMPDLLLQAIEDASQMGQFHCRECDGYYTAKDMAMIPIRLNCNEIAKSSICKKCLQQRRVV